MHDVIALWHNSFLYFLARFFFTLEEHGVMGNRTKGSKHSQLKSF